MINILGDGGGDSLRGVDEALAEPGLALHLYGKAKAAAKRKMGHFTVLGDTAEDALARAEAARRRLRWG
jgi:5-(carboxyamino)imidazole ribonucleotide synthase